MNSEALFQRALGNSFSEIQAGNIDAGLSILEMLVPQTNAERCGMKHAQALAAFRKSLANQAAFLFHEALDLVESADANLRLQMDYLCFLHGSGKVDLWRDELTRFEQFLLNPVNVFDPTLRAKGQILLGKFLEEDGDVCRALNIFFQVANLAGVSPLERVQALAQTLRIRAIEGPSEELGLIYAELIRIDEDQLYLDLNVEIQHALILAELPLVGTHHAWARLQNSMEMPTLPSIDKRQIIVDFIEETYVLGLELNPKIQELVVSLDGFDVFEEAVVQLLQNDKIFSLSQLNALCPKMSRGCFLRLLTLFLAKDQTPSLQNEVLNKMNLLLTGLSVESRAYWLARMKRFLSNESKTLRYCAVRKSVIYQNRSVDLSKKRIMFQLTTVPQIIDLNSDTVKLRSEVLLEPETTTFS